MPCLIASAQLKVARKLHVVLDRLRAAVERDPTAEYLAMVFFLRVMEDGAWYCLRFASAIGAARPWAAQLQTGLWPRASTDKGRR